MNINIEITEHSSHEELSSKDQELVTIAINQLKTSHSPYSSFSVGASVRLENDDTWGGSNQENSSYPVGICAERVALSVASTQSHGKSVDTMVVVYSDAKGNHDLPLAPCGMCRQAIREQTFRQKKTMKMILTTKHGKTLVVKNADDLLPLSFTLDT
tara:strand:+ start:1309 stop:1779 length:471 start_codon:yes stop_codon:yes gene_type:complete